MTKQENIFTIEGTQYRAANKATDDIIIYAIKKAVRTGNAVVAQIAQVIMMVERDKGNLIEV